MKIAKVAIRTLPSVSPPIPEGGGRIHSSTGELAQITNGESFSFLAYIEFILDAEKRRGNHYHETKTEILYIISGKLQAHYYDIDTGESMKVILQAGDLVAIEPRCAHAYVPLERSQAVELSATAYDPADTLAYKLSE